MLLNVLYIYMYVAVTHSYMLLLKQITVFVVVEVSYTNVQNLLCTDLAEHPVFRSMRRKRNEIFSTIIISGTLIK
jgi:hypothetical protein